MEQIYTQDGCLYAAQTVMYVHQVDLINLCVCCGLIAALSENNGSNNNSEVKMPQI